MTTMFCVPPNLALILQWLFKHSQTVIWLTNWHPETQANFKVVQSKNDSITVLLNTQSYTIITSSCFCTWPCWQYSQHKCFCPIVIQFSPSLKTVWKHLTSSWQNKNENFFLLRNESRWSNCHDHGSRSNMNQQRITQK